MKLMVIIGSVREGRRAQMVADWAVAQLRQDTELEIDLADLKEVDLPFFNEAVTPDSAHGQFQNPKGTAWAARVAQADAFIMLVAEYNHGPTAVLKNAIDWVYDGWLNKPVGFISYGGQAGAARAVEQLKMIVMNVKLIPLNDVVMFSRASQAFDDNGQPKDAERFNQSLAALVADLKDLQRRFVGVSNSPYNYGMQILDVMRDMVRHHVVALARWLNKMTRGRLSPNIVTAVGLLAHIPIALLIASTKHNILAAVLLVIFGLFDALDGELARLQNKASNRGMLLDAASDRIKEIILYIGIGSAVVFPTRLSADYINDPGGEFILLALVIAALGGSLLVSYVKAKGETALKDSDLSPNEINRLFQDGLMRFEIRMALIILGLITNWLAVAVAVIALFSWITAVDRLSKISRKLRDVQD